MLYPNPRFLEHCLEARNFKNNLLMKETFLKLIIFVQKTKKNVWQKFALPSFHGPYITIWYNTHYINVDLGPNFLCWISRVVQFNTWLISSWDAYKCWYKLSKCTKLHLQRILALCDFWDLKKVASAKIGIRQIFSYWWH